MRSKNGYINHMTAKITQVSEDMVRRVVAGKRRNAIVTELRKFIVNEEQKVFKRAQRKYNQLMDIQKRPNDPDRDHTKPKGMEL
jgi:23S rRNA maturation mini-RNase III